MAGVGDITTALRSAQAGLLANQQVLNIIANNVANVNTPGYSRKNPNLISRVTGNVGSGVIVNGVSRQVNEDLLRTLRIENSTLSALKIKHQLPISRVNSSTLLNHYPKHQAARQNITSLSGAQKT
jgi:flagellar hook-associated protein FlgK